MTAARCYPHLGGVERHVEAVRAELTAMGYTIHVAEVGEGLRALLSLPRLMHMLHSEHYDVIHAHDFVAALVTWSAVIASGVRRKIYSTIHGYEGYPLRKVHIWAHRIAHAVSAKVIAIGAYIDVWYGTKSNVVLHGGVPDASGTEEPSQQLVLFVSRLASDTNCLEVTQAFIAVSERAPHVQFRIYGFGPLKSVVEALCEGTAVQFCGPVSNVQSVLASASVIVANSYLAILEAFSRGKPVVAYYGNALKHDYLHEIALASGAVELAGSIHEIDQLLSGVLADSGRRATLSARGLAYSERFVWRNVARDYLNLWSLGR